MAKGRWIIKLGTGILTRRDGRPDRAQFKQLVDQVAGLMRRGFEVILVSSGAIGAGMAALGLRLRPTFVHESQSCAAIGQVGLMAEYQRQFARHGLVAAQLLLTYWDLDSRACYTNAANTLETLLRKKRVVPVINENDAIASDEIQAGKFGDNDRLSAHVAAMAHADRLVILSNVDGLLDKPGPGGKVVPIVRRLDPATLAMATGTESERSVGGMATKLEAARVAAQAGIETIVANGRRPTILAEIARGRFKGTRFLLGRRKEKAA